MLARNDKIIIAVGVVVLIIAAVAVVIYVQPENILDNRGFGNGMDEYTIEWEENTRNLETISEFAGKNAPYEGTFSISKGNLKSITFNLSWTDNRVSIIGNSGIDTLEIEVTDPDGNIYTESGKPANKNDVGYVEFTISVKNNMPSTETVEANDWAEVETMLEEDPYYMDKWFDEDFEYKVSCSIGEKRIIRKLRDSGNNFDLDISYEYYDADITEELDDDDDENKNTSLDDQSFLSRLSTLINTGSLVRY